MSGKKPAVKLEHPVQMGVIGGAQGLRGEVRVKAFTDEPVEIGEYGTLYGLDGRAFEILDIRPHKEMVVIRFRGVNDRNEAERLNGTELYVERDVLDDEELDEEEYFYADLEGLEARDAEGNSWGVISAIFDFGAGDILELTQQGKRAQLIPFSESSVLEIDFEGGTILIDPFAAGLIGEDDDEDQDGKGK
ncbi:ribosome maturation factor RimM [Rhizobium sp. KVB221]|uniref:Ribosome maturation factor RimM n=1 Tax=Rhizobium setariae TaxID=2801340 RepID=A0A937CRK9_9HYPH|nr:ribosome maturation factor RimM [Rhizobium setariae]MBL0374782.1 ribosome maturation factor RimM [Rhizobium setariae]